MAAFNHVTSFATLVFILFAFLKNYLALELNEETAFLMTCPISSKNDLDYLRHLADSGHPIDIFEEKISVDSETIVQLLTDEVTSEILLSRAGCFEEKGRSAVKKIFTPELEPKANVKIGPEFHNHYHSYQDIMEQLEYYHKKHTGQVKLLTSIGKSHEGRDLKVIHITGAGNTLGTKPLIWIMAGQHAREWIAPASAMVFIELILSNQQILNDYEFAVMPLVNPDGYEYSRTKNRMWRKNRGGSKGVDLNRNWDHLWCEIGSSKNPNTDDYCGPSAASEPEIRSTQKYILSLNNRILGFDVHSYSQLILRNYGWTKQPSPHETLLANMSQKMSEAMKSLYQVHYTPMLSSGLYPSSGSAEDWMYVKAGIPGFVMEMRDKGQFGFHLPRSQIKPTGIELYSGIIAAISSFTTEIKIQHNPLAQPANK